VWRLVLAKVATLEEIERHWSLTDVFIANRLLDFQQAVERRAVEEAKRR